MRAEITENSVEISMSRSEAVLIGISALLLTVLFILAGWQITAVAGALSVIGAVVVDVVEGMDIRLAGHHRKWVLR